jgi:Na+/proline symporter
MSPLLVVSFIVCYFLLLVFVSYLTGRGAGNESFFVGNRKAPWYLVAFGMIGASLSGVTFISVPGWVGASQFSYMQMVLGYLVGYLVIGTVLMPLYYKLNLTSIYTYLKQRFGFWSYKTGASFFLISRIIGASFRLYLVAMVLQLTVFDSWGIPFAVTVFLTVLLIWMYTAKAGIKTIIRTDALQTLFMILSVIVSIILISRSMGLDFNSMINLVRESEYSQVFFFEDWNDKKHFAKQFISGAFIAIVMTGLDQDMMQKNLSCKNIEDAQKNMFWFSIVLVLVNFVFLGLGALLYLFAEKNGIEIPVRTDELYPLIATQGYLDPLVGAFFILGLIAAAYSSADSALAALTTSVCVDFLGLEEKEDVNSLKKRKVVHISISVILVFVILIFRSLNDSSVISAIFTIAGYTYGPLLGLYAFGLFNRIKVKDNYVPVVCFLSPIVCLILNKFSVTLFSGYQFGFELLVLNGAITFLGLYMIRVNVKP